MNEESIFHHALEIPDAAKRAAYLDEACGSDVELRQRMENLLHSHSEADEFLNPPDPTIMDSRNRQAQDHLYVTIGSDSKPAATATTDYSVGARVSYFGDYEIRGEIARGGMGAVYRARQVSLNRMVALKMILSSKLASDGDIQRFLAEAEAAANLDHPNIVPIYEVGEHDGQQYFTMKLIEGGSLAQRVDSFSDRQSAELVVKVARGVHAAHQSGILHRDLKPGNILLERDGTPCITDFGLAKQIDDENNLTQSGQILGTPNYMSPEQARGETKSLTTATDIYSLGAVLYELLSGKPPFQSESIVETLRQVADAEPASLRSVSATVDRDLETIALKCLEKEPRRRYGSAEALAEDLERWLGGEPITARRISAPERLVKWARRKPALASMWLVIALFLTTLVVGGPAVAIHQARMRKRAVDLAEERDALRITAEKNLLRAETNNLYRTEIMVAGQALQASTGAKQGRRLLLNWWPEPGKEDRRGWEWYYLAGLVWPANHSVLRGHTHSVQHGAFSADGNWFYTFGAERSYRIWNTRTGEQTGVLRANPKAKGPVLPLYLAQDSKHLVWADMTAIHISDASSGEVIRTFESTHTKEVGSVCWSNDGELVVSKSFDGSVRIWNPETGKMLRQVCQASTVRAGTVIFSPNSRYLIVQDRDDKEASQFHVRIFDREKNFSQVVQRDNAIATLRPVFSLDESPWSPDSKRLLIYNDNGELTVWNPFDKKTDVVLEGDNSFRNIFYAGWSPDGSVGRMVNDGTIRIHDPNTGKELRRFSGHSGSARYVAWRPDGKRIAGSDTAGNIRIWDLESTSDDPIHILRGHSGQIRWVGWSPSGETFASTSSDYTARFWNLGSRPAGPQVIEVGEAINGLAWDKAATHIATAGAQPSRWETANIRIHDLSTGEARLLSTGGGRNLDWSSKGTLASYFTIGKLHLWNTDKVDSNAVIVERKDPLSFVVYSSQPAWSPDGQRLATSQLNGVTVWDIPDGDLSQVKEVGLITSNITWARSVRWSPDGRRLAIAFRGSVQQLEVWDAVKLERIWMRKRPKDGWGYINAVAWSSDGEFLASSDPDSSIRIWKAETGELVSTLHGHTGDIWSLDWHPTDNRLASASGDGTVKVWNPQIEGEVVSLVGHTAGVNRVRWSPDGHRIASAGADGKLIIWDAMPGYLYAASPIGEKHLEQRTEQNPADDDANLRLIDLLIKRGDWQQAGKKLRKWFERPSNMSTSPWYASNWWVRGPYPPALLEEQLAEKELDLFSPTAIAGETNSTSPTWQFVHESSHRYLDLKQVFDDEGISAYGQLRIFSPKRQAVKIEFRCHHAGRVWLNGTRLHSDSPDEERNLNSEFDNIDAVLESGWNTLIVKVINPDGSDRFGAGIEIRSAD